MQDWRCFDDKHLSCPPEGCPIMYGCARARGWREGLEPPVGYFDVAMLENLISRRSHERQNCKICGRFTDRTGRCSQVFTVEPGFYEHG